MKVLKLKSEKIKRNIMKYYFFCSGNRSNSIPVIHKFTVITNVLSLFVGCLFKTQWSGNKCHNDYRKFTTKYIQLSCAAVRERGFGHFREKAKRSNIINSLARTQCCKKPLCACKMLILST